VAGAATILAEDEARFRPDRFSPDVAGEGN
jgi:hypothetical protein